MICWLQRKFFSLEFQLPDALTFPEQVRILCEARFGMLVWTIFLPAIVAWCSSVTWYKRSRPYVCWWTYNIIAYAMTCTVYLSTLASTLYRSFAFTAFGYSWMWISKGRRPTEAIWPNRWRLTCEKGVEDLFEQTEDLLLAQRCLSCNQLARVGD